jgi:hypothetical protein
MVMSFLRNLLIDYALDSHNQEMFMKLTSPAWEQFVVQSDEIGDLDAVTNYLVMFDKDTQRIVSLSLPDSDRPTVFAVSQKEWDCCGWRDSYGLTFYDRLRTAGHKHKTMWVGVNRHTWNDICNAYRVVHPGDLVVAHPSRRLYVHDTHSL